MKTSRSQQHVLLTTRYSHIWLCVTTICSHTQPLLTRPRVSRKTIGIRYGYYIGTVCYVELFGNPILRRRGSVWQFFYETARAHYASRDGGGIVWKFVTSRDRNGLGILKSEGENPIMTHMFGEGIFPNVNADASPSGRMFSSWPPGIYSFVIFVIRYPYMAVLP